MKLQVLFYLTVFVLFSACKIEKPSDTKRQKVVYVPVFSADSAFQYIQNQVDFGPRVPNSPGHKACAVYLAEKLRSFGAEVIEQRALVTAFNGDQLNIINIIGSFNLENRNRILLFAHWDTRPWSDEDPDPANYYVPVIGANDGGSGVGVLLEIARQISQHPPSVGIDIIFFDAEDYGAPKDYTGDAPHSWCLGSQYWGANPHVPGYSARFGILLDMVGATNAVFYREQVSDQFAPSIVDKVWNVASSLGFSQFFINERGGAITDDHVYVNQLARIPSINIIDFDPQREKGFFKYWHTINDDMDNICKRTLRAVGSTVMHVIYHEN